MIRTRERLVVAPRMQRRTVVSAIRAARERLVLSVFRCDDEAVLRALADAANRGVHVRVLMTARARAASQELEALHARLVACGIAVRRFGGGMKYHAKYLVADAHLALVTTMNFTSRCFDRTCDFTVVTRELTVVSGLRELFDADWAGRPVRLTAAQRDRLIVGPDHAPRDRFAALVHEARQRIRIVDARPTDARLLQRLDERRRAGVTLERARRRELRPLRRHGRLLIVDGTAAAIGSFALSPRAFDRRRELALITRDPQLVAQLEAFWQAHVSARRSTVVDRPADAVTEMTP